MTAPTPNGQSPDAVREAVVTPNLRQQVRDCIGETVPLRRRWVSAIMDQVVTPLLAQRDAAIARAEEAERALEKEGEALELEIELHGEASGDLSTALSGLAQATAQVAGMRVALEQARTELEAYELDATGETYNSLSLNAALTLTEAPHDD